ncbi:MAG: LrgB family protein [Clostridiales bacterium]|nr:LrgB family protein [Clostridiales bacterium]
MKESLIQSSYFGLVLTIGLYVLAGWLKRKMGWKILTPFLAAVAATIACLVLLDIDYDSYAASSGVLTYLLTPMTVCLAVPMYKQLHLLKKHMGAVLISVFSGVMANALTIFFLSLLFRLKHKYYVSILPKSVTSAIALGVCEEAGGIASFTVIGLSFAGILGSIIAVTIFRVLHIEEPIARGLALGNASHMLGAAKALELGETESAMASLTVVVAGLMTVFVVPVMAGLL